MIRRASDLPLKDAVDGLPKLKPENPEDPDVPTDSGDVELVAESDRVGDDGLNAVLRRRRDCLGWRGRNLSKDMVLICSVVDVLENLTMNT